MLDGKVVNINDVIAMKKKIDDLELVNSSRDKRITEVSKGRLQHLTFFHTFVG